MTETKSIITKNQIPIIKKGNGEPLIILHGFMENKEMFLPLINYFSNYFTVYAYDLCGFGSNKMPYPYDLGDYCKEFFEVVKLTSSKKVNVLAHSFGGRIVLKVASQCDVIKKAVLCSSAGLKSRFSLKRTCKKLAYKTLKPIIKKEKLEKIFFSGDYNMTTGNLRDSFKKVTSETLDKNLSLIKCPVLAVYGKNDRETPLYMGKRLEKNIENCTLYVMDGCGHFCFLENSAKFNYIVREFLL